MNQKLIFFFILIFIPVIFSNCSKKSNNPEKLFKNKDISGLSSIAKDNSASVNKISNSMYFLIKLDRVSKVVDSYKAISDKNPQKAKKLLDILVPKLINNLYPKTLGVHFKNGGQPEKASTPALSNKTLGVHFKDALTGLSPYMSKIQKQKVANSVFNWFSQDPENRIETGDYKLKKTLEFLWFYVNSSTAKKIAKAHAAWMMKDYKNRGIEAVVIFKRARTKIKTKVSAKIKTYRSYYKYFKKAVVNYVIDNYSTTKSGDGQNTDIKIILDYGTKEDKIRAGKKILNSIKTTKRFSLNSIKALGIFNTPGAAKYLENFTKEGSNLKIHTVALETVALLKNDPVALDILYKDFLPFLKDIEKQQGSSEKVAKIAKVAAKGLFLSRKCSLNPDNFNFLKKIYTMKLPKELFEARNSIKPILFRLILCTGKEKGAKLILNKIKFPFNLNEVKKTMECMDSLDYKYLHDIIKLYSGKKQIEKKVIAIWLVSSFGKREDSQLIKKLYNDTSQIPSWGKNVGEFAKEAVSNVENRLKK